MENKINQNQDSIEIKYNELNELLLQREKMQKVEITEKHWSKLKGDDTEAGSWCEIIWDNWGVDYPDKGYLFDLPIGNASDEGDIFIHIPKPQNPEGIDTPPPVFLHLYMLMTNELIKSITVLK